LEAASRIQQFGLNATPDADQNLLRLVVGKFVAPVPCLLEAAIVLQIFLHEYLEAAVVFALLIFNALLGLFQEGRAQATIAALKSRLALNASVQRDGEWRIMPAAQLVPGDLVKLSLGSVVPADVHLLQGDVLLDHSMLTGESLPIEASGGSDTYAGALVRRGEALAEVTATGTRTKFGRTAELVRTAHVTSTEQKAVFRVVLYLAIINGAIAAALIGYAFYIRMPPDEIIPLALIAILGSIPVALPATFTLATAIGARALAREGVLPTRLSAVDEAATLNVLCVDKTGTITRNELAVSAVTAMPGYDEATVLARARLASSDAGQDPVDAAIRGAASASPTSSLNLTKFIPFDPATKMAQAVATNSAGEEVRVVKGAFAVVMALSQPSPVAVEKAGELESNGFRVLGVAVGKTQMTLIGLIALSDPPRSDSSACIADLRRLGVPVTMVTGDSAKTAAVIAKVVGLDGPCLSSGLIPDRVSPADFAVFAGVLPEDKFTLVKAFQKAGYTVGMCGDGANDAPALRQAQIGVAVSTATDVAKSAAGIVLTEAGLSGIRAAVMAGRVAFQRILTYTLRSIVHKVRQVLLLAVGLAITGHAILTPMLMVISMVTGDFLAMSATTDNVRPSSTPNSWHIGRLTAAGVVMGFVDLAFCVAILAIGKYRLSLDVETLQTLTLVTLVFSGQALFYVVRERDRLWSSRPSAIVIACSVADMLIIPSLAVNGILMAPLPITIVLSIFGAAIAFAFVLDAVKFITFRVFNVS
jgi:H+-transporting ATPase